MVMIALLSCLLLAAPLAAASNERNQAKEILSQREYRGYRVEAAPPADVEYTQSQGRAGSTNNSRQPERRAASGRVQPPAPPSRGSGGTSMGSLSPAFVEAIFWVLGAIALAVVSFLLVRWWLDRRPRKQRVTVKAVESEEVKDDEPPAQSAPARAFPALEDELAKALAAGDFALAAVLRFRLFWLTAGWRAVNDEADPRTWRDAVRMVRSDERRRELRRLLTLVESIRYGRHKPDAHEFSAWRAKLEAIDNKALLA